MESIQEHTANQSQEKSVKHLKGTILCCLLIFSGTILDALNIILPIGWESWLKLFNLSKDAQIFGALLLAHIYIQYKHIHLKVLTFFLCVWRIIVTGINATDLNTVINIYFIIGLSLIYYTWVYRLGHLKEINSTKPDHNEAYYIFLPINSIKGLLQAVFIPWQPARYETRLIVDGDFVYSVYRNKFSKKPKSKTDFDKLGGITIPLNRRLTFTERTKLDGLVGKRAIPGIRDCRRLLVVKDYK